MLNSFSQWLGHLNESLWGTWNYTVPEDKKQQMYDFYMLEYLLPPGIHLYLPPMEFGPEREEPEEDVYGRKKDDDGKKSGDNARTNVHKYEYALYEAANKLLPSLRKELLEAVIFALAAELRHVYDYEKNRATSNQVLTERKKEIIERVRKAMGDKYANMLRDYTLALKNRTDAETKPLLDRPQLPKNYDDYGHGDANFKDYRTSFRAMKQVGASDEDWAKLCSWLFYNVKWASLFGGPAWGQIADGWLGLEKAKSGGQMLTYIDHVYDLQHNTNTVFNKLRSYMKEGGYGWVLKALDHKRDLMSPFEMMEHVSPPMKELARYGIKIKTGKTFADLEQEWPEILKKKAANFNYYQKLKWEKDKRYGKDAGYPQPKDLTPEEYARKHVPISYKLDTISGINQAYLKGLAKAGGPKDKDNPLDADGKVIYVGSRVQRAYAAPKLGTVAAIHDNLTVFVNWDDGKSKAYESKHVRVVSDPWNPTPKPAVEPAPVSPSASAGSSGITDINGTVINVGDKVKKVTGPGTNKTGKIIDASNPGYVQVKWDDEVTVKNQFPKTLKVIASAAAKELKDKNGAAINVGDKVKAFLWGSNMEGTVKYINSNEFMLGVKLSNGTNATLAPSAIEVIKAAPEVKDKNGVPIKVGDSVLTTGHVIGKIKEITTHPSGNVSVLVKAKNGEAHYLPNTITKLATDKDVEDVEELEDSKGTVIKVGDTVKTVSGNMIGKVDKIKGGLVYAGNPQDGIFSYAPSNIIVTTPEEAELSKLAATKAKLTIKWNEIGDLQVPLKIARLILGWKPKYDFKKSISLIGQIFNLPISNQEEKIMKLHQEERENETYYSPIGHASFPNNLTVAQAGQAMMKFSNAPHVILTPAVLAQIEGFLLQHNHIAATTLLQKATQYSLAAAKGLAVYLKTELYHTQNNMFKKALPPQW